MSFKQKISELIDNKAHQFIDMNDKIWGLAEIRFQEHQSAKLQKEVLEAEGFKIETVKYYIHRRYQVQFDKWQYPIISSLDLLTPWTLVRVLYTYYFIISPKEWGIVHIRQEVYNRWIMIIKKQI